MPALPFLSSPMLALFGLVAAVATGYIIVAVVGIRGLRFRPAAVALVDATGIPAAERAVLTVGHGALEKLGFRYDFCVQRRSMAAESADAYECFYRHTGFDAIALMTAHGGVHRVVFRSYRPDGWSLETHPTPPLQPLPRPTTIEAWTPAQAASLADLWQAHLTRFRQRTAGVGALLPDPGQLLAHEQRLAADALASHVRSGLLAPVSALSDQHRFTWGTTLQRVRSSGLRAQLRTMQAAGLSPKRLALGSVAVCLCLMAAGTWYGARRAAAMLAEAQEETQAVGLPKTPAELSDAMSPTERRTLEQGALWWVVAMAAAPESGIATDGDAPLLAALRSVPDAQKRLGSAPPPDAPAIQAGASVSQALDRAYRVLASDLKKQDERKDSEAFHADAGALATLLRDTHWSLGERVQARRVQRYLELLAALEAHWLHSPMPGAEFITQIHAAMPLPSDLQRDAVAAYFLDKMLQPGADQATPLVRFFRDATPLGSVSLTGHLHCEAALWQAVQNKREWSDPALLPSHEQENNLIAPLHQLPSIAARHAQLEILAAYAPRRALCTASIAAQMLMKQLPTPELYEEPVTRALRKLSGTGPGIEVVPDALLPLLQITLPTVPPKVVQWQLRGTGGLPTRQP